MTITNVRNQRLALWKVGIEYDLDEAVFTPSMAKRTGPGPFAAAPIVQGDWDGTGTPDRLSFPRGNQIAGDWYDNFDPYQGSVVFWITPEWDGNDGREHGVIEIEDFRIFKDTSNHLYLSYHDGSTYRNLGVAVATWAAGATYFVVCRWDIRNTLDGTNYMCVSINDTHTFGITAFVDSVTPSVTGYVGTLYGAANSANAIIEGLTIYRRVLWDGAYGVDVGNGDELAAIYAAGAGADPCLTTGSWDAVFCLPTDSATGALVTGTGEAWSHPHSSNVPEDWYFDDGYYGGAEHAIGFNGDTTNINFGSNATIDNIPAADYTFDAWVRLDSRGEGGYGRIFYKSANFLLSCGPGFLFIAQEHATSTATAFLPYVFDGKWHHIMAVYDLGTLSFEHFFLDGRDLIYNIIAGVGAYSGDAAATLYGGNNNVGTGCLDGDFGWMRFSAGKLHTADFIPPRAFPGGGIESWSMADGTGANVVASVTSPACDGTLANGTWVHPWEDQGTPLDLQGIEFDGAATSVVIADNAAYQDLHAGAFTVRVWIRADGWGENNAGRIFDKTRGGAVEGWYLCVSSTTGMASDLYTAGTSAAATATLSAFAADAKLHLITMQYDNLGDRKIYFWVDGIPTSYGVQTAATGAIVTDVGNDLYHGNRLNSIVTFDGLLGGWADISNVLRYTNGEAFVPESPMNPPAPDGNTVWATDYSDGAGITLTDDSATGVNGTITFGNGRWWNTRDMDVNAVGEKVFPFGNMFGVDAANEGLQQTWTGLTPGWDYVVRITGYPSADGRGQLRLVAYDEIGAAAISTFDGPTYYGIHSGANNSASLIAAAGKFPQSLIGATVYNITDGSLGVITACSGDYTTITGPLGGGVDNDWDTNDVFRIFWPGITEGFASHPWIETWTVELPAACTSLSLRVLSASTEGFFFVGQAELLRQLVTNPSLEGVYAGVPPIPPGWTNSGLDAGDTQAEVAVVHSGAESMEWNPAAIDDEFIWQGLALTIGDFASWGAWVYGDGTQGLQLGVAAGRSALQYTTGTYQINTTLATSWQHNASVWRQDGGGPNPQLRGLTGAVGDRFLDDFYLILLDPVSLTVTPASEANSAESGGERVDGYDSQVQPVNNRLKARSGYLDWRVRPRHDPANLIAFSDGNNPVLVYGWGDATNYFVVWATAANTMQLQFDAAGGGPWNANWACAGEWTEDDELYCELEYRGHFMQFRVNGVPVATVTSAVNFTTVPTALYWGLIQAGGQQIDAVFKEP